MGDKACQDVREGTRVDTAANHVRRQGPRRLRHRPLGTLFTALFACRGVVLLNRVGRARPPGVAWALAVATLGFYGLYWNLVAHRELFRQFELKEVGRVDGHLWFFLGLLVFPPVFWLYQATFVSNVAYIRRRFGLRKGISVGRFLAFLVPSRILTVLAILVLVEVGYLRLLVILDDPEIDVERARERIRTLLLVASSMLIAAFALATAGYIWLQRSINDIWVAYTNRATQLTQAGAVPKAPTSSSPPWAPPS